jgi:hypothetical protein
MTSARELCYEILHQEHLGSQFKAWIQYYNLECRYGQTRFIRKCLEKGLRLVKDNPRPILDLWLSFERDFGDLGSLERCENILAEWIKDNSYVEPEPPAREWRVRSKESTPQKRKGNNSFERTSPKSKKAKPAEDKKEVPKPKAKSKAKATTGKRTFRVIA